MNNSKPHTVLNGQEIQKVLLTAITIGRKVGLGLSCAAGVLRHASALLLRVMCMHKL